MCCIVKGLCAHEILRIKKAHTLSALLFVDGYYVIHKIIGDKRLWKRIRIILSAVLNVAQKTEYLMKRCRAFQNVENAELS